MSNWLFSFFPNKSKTVITFLITFYKLLDCKAFRRALQSNKILFAFKINEVSTRIQVSSQSND